MTEIVHVVAWRLNGKTPLARHQQAEAVVAAVEATRGQVPGMVALDVGHNVIEASDAWDVGAVMVFQNRAALDAYQTHPQHLALKGIVAPLRSARSQLDFERATPLNGKPAQKGES